MPSMMPLAEVLRLYMRRAPRPYTPGLLSRFSGVPKATLVNWLEGHVTQPRRWHDIVKVADALRLSASDADMLLEAAGFPPIAELLRVAAPSDRALLQPWVDATQAAAMPNAVRATNLPAPPTPFIGRVTELAVVRELLRDSYVRLVTLTGTGGVGKTRLAVQAAADLLDNFADGVVFVDLAALTQHELVLASIALALGIGETSGQSLATVLADFLRERTILLVLDNFEHVTPAAAAVASLLNTAPLLKLLITSRVVLRLYGEHEVVVPPLVLPDRSQLPPLARLSQNEAVALFVVRARAVDPAFMLTAANARLIADICARLDGLPLAIELAAARVKLLSPQGLLDRLRSRLGLLTWGARNLPARQQTLRGTLDWSYDLLAAPHQLLLAQLAVFIGGCTLDAIEAVVLVEPRGAQQIVLDGMMALADNSLVRGVADGKGQPRYLLLEIIREYAQERLEEGALAAEVRQRHAAYYLNLAERAEPELSGPQQLGWLARIEQEGDNLRAAFDHMLQTSEYTDAARLSSALWEFWRIRGQLREGRQRLRAVLEQRAHIAAPLRARVYLAAGRLAREQGDLPEAESLLAQSLALLRTDGDTMRVAQVLGHLGVVAYDQGQFDQAIALHSESLSLRQASGDWRGVAGTLTNLGEVARHQGNYQRALEFHEQSLGQFQALADPWGIALASMNLGMAAYELGAYSAAAVWFAACVRLSVDTGDHASLAECFEGLALVAAAQSNPERALRLAAAAEQLREMIGAVLPPVDRVNFEQRIVPARDAVGGRSEMLWSAGRAMTVEQAITFALQTLHSEIEIVTTHKV